MLLVPQDEAKESRSYTNILEETRSHYAESKQETRSIIRTASKISEVPAISRSPKKSRFFSLSNLLTATPAFGYGHERVQATRLQHGILKSPR